MVIGELPVLGGEGQYLSKGGMFMKKIIILSMAAMVFFSSSALAGSFTDNGNGTVSDSSTGLMWQKDDDNTKRNWQDSVYYCDGLVLSGYSDWRLPDINDLMSLSPPKSLDVADKTYFPTADNKVYWSSRSGRITGPGQYTEDSSVAMVFGGFPLSVPKTNSTVHVRCVR